jgi:hypothetical protein
VWNVIFILRLPLQAAELGNQFYENMKLYDPSDREAIEWGLKRVFDYDEGKINTARCHYRIPCRVRACLRKEQLSKGALLVERYKRVR